MCSGQLVTECLPEAAFASNCMHAARQATHSKDEEGLGSTAEPSTAAPVALLSGQKMPSEAGRM
jgi:hypothetical protein